MSKINRKISPCLLDLLSTALARKVPLPRHNVRRRWSVVSI